MFAIVAGCRRILFAPHRLCAICMPVSVLISIFTDFIEAFWHKAQLLFFCQF